ncbi:MAG: hemolysin III family protein [Planctomycetia bacterium]|nr:hemolysin III family protein [Planctomycetia bacterium]
MNGLIHGLAGTVSLGGAAWMMNAAIRAGDILMIVGCASFAVSLTIVFAMSTLSHVVRPPRLRQLFRTLDQASIYLLTAGSCTPFFLRYLVPHGWGWMLSALWGIALFAVWAKLRGDRVNSVSIGFNLLLGWFPILAARPLLTNMPTGCLSLVIGAGACYMIGVVFLSWDERCRFFHSIWHTFVVAGSACTWAGIVWYVI